MGVFRWYTIPLVAAVLAAVTGLTLRLADLLPADILPVQLSAGVALTALVAHGLRCWPGVFLGIYAVSLWLAGMDSYAQALFDAAVISVQALVGALLIRPLLREDLSATRDSKMLRLLLLAGPVACLVSTAATQVPRFHDAGFTSLQPWLTGMGGGDWMTAWSANTLGVLVAGPPSLALWLGSRYLRRLWGVSITLILAGLLVVIGHVALFRFEIREVELEDSARLESVLQGGLMHFDRGIETLHSVEHFFQASSFVGENEFAIFTARILSWPGLDSIEWVPRVTEGSPFPGSGAEGELAPVPGVDRYPGLYVESATPGERRPVTDYRSAPIYWSAMERARDSATVTAAEPRPLSQTGRPGLAVFVALYRPGFASADATVAERREALRGFIKGNFDLTGLVGPLSEAAAAQGVELGLVDLTPGSPPMILLSNLPAEARASERRHFTFAGRLFQLDLALSEAWVPGTGPVARLYQGFSVLAMFLICLAVLASAGRHGAAQAAVLARTAALRASERHLEVTLDSIGDGVLVVDTMGFVTRLNPMAEQLTGWRSRQAQGRPLEDVFRIVREDSSEPAVVPVMDVLASGVSRGLANHTVLIDSDGVERAIAHSAAPILGAEGEPLGVVLVFRDISEERAAERALEASEQRYRELIEQAPYGIFVQTGGSFAYLNPTALRLLGARDQADLLGRPVLDFLHPENREAVAERIRQLNLLGIPSASQEGRWRRLDGSFFHAEATAVPHVHDGERGALVMVRDISARKAAEAQRDRFFDLSLDPQCILDASGRFLRVNAAFSDVLGWSEEEFLNSRYLDLIHPDERADAERKHGSIHAENAAQRLEVRFSRSAGDWRWLSWNAVADEHGGLIYAVARDVTERRETIQALTRARHEAEYANRAKSAFLATMSHEIRTPMNAVVGLAEVLSHGVLGEHEGELVRNISVSARSLLRLIDDILDFSKIEAGRLELEQAPVAFETMVEDLCQALLPMARERGVALSAFVAPELPRHILGDDTRLRQLLNNLIGNAIKFSAAPRREQGQVRVRAEPGEGDTLALTVTDNGIGMSRETLDHIFRPFTQGEPSTTRRYGGTGLGLAISKRLVELMGGEIRLDSREGQGTTATVVLPLQPVTAVPGEVEPPADLGGVCCVLVETAELPAGDWQRYLHSAGASAIRVPTLEAALALDGGAGQLRVVILDLREPAHGSLPVNTAFRGDEHTRFVLVDTGRRGTPRIQGGKMVILEGGSPRRHQLLQAVAMAVAPPPRATAAAGAGVAETARGASLVPVSGEHRILVVEDDDMNRKVIIEQLHLLGYTAEVVGDGGSALALWRKHRHDLVLSDLHMPEMDGYDFVRAVRDEEEPSARTPVVALTANAMHGEDSRALASGFDDYLTKPVSLAALEAVLRHWLSSAAGHRESSSVKEADPGGATTQCWPDGGSEKKAVQKEPLQKEALPKEPSATESPAMRGEAMAGRPAENKQTASRSAEEASTESGSTKSRSTESEKVLDLAILGDFIGNDKARVNSFVADYREAASHLREEILAANEQQDLAAVASFAHRLKSSSLWAGAVSLGKACEHLEKAGYAGNRAEVNDCLARFLVIHGETLMAIDRHLAGVSP